MAPQTHTSRTRPGLLVWWAVLIGFGGILIGGLRGPFANVHLTSPLALFWLVVLAAGLCWVASVALMTVAWHRGLAELGILGSALGMQSCLAFVHGLTVPGILYGANTAVLDAAFLALPAALLVAGPVLLRRSGIGAALGRHWRSWALGWTAASIAACALLLIYPNVLVAPTMGTPIPIVIGVLSLSVAVGLSVRHLRLYWVGRLRASLVVSLAFLWLGLSGLVWLGQGPFTVGFWTAHVFDIAGVTAAAITLLVGYRSNHSVTTMLAPVLTRDPLVALDLGLSPAAHRFMAMLERKDEITRDHVVRVGELALRAGERAGLHGTRLRTLGLAALFHDIGKLEVPEEILTKPSVLTEEEMAIVRTHPEAGERLLRGEPELAPAAGFVRSHHERIDGTGYPDGLSGSQLTLEVGIISACDAFDAICHTRNYREGLGQERGVEVLKEHAGTQWSAVAVALVVDTLSTGAPNASGFDDVGRTTAWGETGCGCVDALPEEVQELVSVV